jgi:tight adherence protein B
VIAWATALAAGSAALMVRSGPPGEPRLHAVLVPRSGARARRVVGARLLAAAAAAAAAVLNWGLLPTCAVIAAVGCGWAVRRRAAEGRKRAANATAVPIVCRVLAAELRAGALPVRALSVAATSAPSEVAAVLREAAAAERLGICAAGPLRRGPAGAESLRFVSMCWEVSSRTGGRLGPVLQRVGAALQAELDSAAAIDAELVGPRLSGRVMAVLPVAGVLLGAALGTDPIRFLLGTGAGAACLASAVGLDLLGLVWISRLANAAAR